MRAAQIQYKKRKDAQQKLDALFERPDRVVVIHYSCESFYDRDDGTSPRITSIAVRNLDNAQTKSFSIHYEAEKVGLALEEIERDYDRLEYEMLTQFYEYVQLHQDYIWLHWNMRDNNYGFEAIAHRYRVLGGEPKPISEDKRYDLSRILFAIYGPRYTSHPRIENLIKMNHISMRDFLTGKEEAEAFENKQYLSLHQSTLRKVNIFSGMAEQAHTNTLVTKSKWWDIHATSIRAFIEWVLETVGFKIIGIVATLWVLYEIIQLIMKQINM